MKKFISICILLIIFLFSNIHAQVRSWIRINQLGYTPKGVKVAVWCSKDDIRISSFSLIDSAGSKTVFRSNSGRNYFSYGPFKNTYRLSFSSFTAPGIYRIKAGNIFSEYFKIDKDVYRGTADFCLQYMRQQRSGFNPFLYDSCHTHDGYTLYGPMPDTTHIDVSGGWHDASDYLQYASTSANATFHLLMAYRDFKNVFSDEKLSNGLPGKNGIADVMDEGKWGLDWLLKMHPRNGWMFNQIGDDRDHMGMRIPKEDPFYGRGFERPVYFVSGSPQQRGRFMNNTTGTSSTAAKFSSTFGLGSLLFDKTDPVYSAILEKKAESALSFGQKKWGATQTASVRSPYIYEEDNWVDDMELANAIQINILERKFNKWNDINLVAGPMHNALMFASMEPLTPWLGADTAKHYQWYPFINAGHYELAKHLKGKERGKIIGYYKTGIEKVWNKAKQNAFYRGIPYIWCSNNLTTSFTIQCYWYKQLTGDNTFEEFEQANFDWLFGCNPWGTSMVYGLPFWGDTPVDPHSAFTHLKNYPINGGLVDGPVYTSIYKNLIGITLKDADEYSDLQSDLAVYHDDYGDYSTNEPTMDGTASLIYLLAAKEAATASKKNLSDNSITREKTLKNTLSLTEHGAVVRGNILKKQIALVFTAHEFADGGKIILSTLQRHHIKGSFFFTGDFYRDPAFLFLIEQARQQHHYLGPHSDKHLLYCGWNRRDSLLVTQQQFKDDLSSNLDAISKLGVKSQAIKYFLPPYEWYNDSIAAWTGQMGMQLINYTPGTKTTADYTWPALSNYKGSQEIYQSVIEKEKEDPNGLNGYILLIHFGTDPRRTDKFYNRLDELVRSLKQKGYNFTTIDQLIK